MSIGFPQLPVTGSKEQLPTLFLMKAAELRRQPYGV